MASTKAPTGLTIERKTGTLRFDAKWKINDNDYGNGQQFQYATVNTQKKFESALNFIKQGFEIEKGITWHSITIGTKQTSTYFVLAASDYFPTNKKPYLAGVLIRVRGNRKSYTVKEKYKDKKGKTKYKDVKVDPGWSAWTYKGFDVEPPAAPKVSCSWSSNYINRTTFNWDCGTEAKTAPYTRVIYQTITKQNYNGDYNKMPGWKTATKNNDASRKDSTYRDEANLGDKIITRAYRARAIGPAGRSDWRYAGHRYAAPAAATNVQVKATRNAKAGSYHFIISWTAPAKTSRPITKTTAEYLVAAPGADLTVPSGAQWTPFKATKDTTGTNRFAYDLSETLDANECIWIRVVTTHDDHDNPSAAVLAVKGQLGAPTISDLQYTDSTHRAEITITSDTSVPGAFHAVVFRPKDGTQNPDFGKIIAIIPNGQTVKQFQCPTWTDRPGFGVYAVVGSVKSQYTRTSDGVTFYTLTTKMTSPTTTSGGNVPQAPATVDAEQIDATNTIQVTWDVPWNAATGAEVSWADHEDAWISTEPPQTHNVENLREALLNITGLELGKTWFVRVRLYQTNTGGTDIFGPYSDTQTVDLSTTPAVPDLQITDEDGIIAADGSTVASWVFVSADGTRQAAATIAEVTEDSGGDYEYSPLEKLSTQQQATLSAEALGWLNGTQHMIAVQVISEAGNPSNWSDPVTITIADALTCEITATNLGTETIDNETQDTMQQLPLTIDVTGAGTGGETRVIIERAESYDLDRPDGRGFNGYEGETIAQVGQQGDDQIEINTKDLIGRLDDGVHYNIVATVQDTAGQTATATKRFIVHWNKQAKKPGGTAIIEDGVAKITPEAPEDANPDDTVDIYRLSADRPELLVKGGTFGTTYVDPFPTLNFYGGYRIVTVTSYGDYITEENELAYTDIQTDNESLFQYIDFDGNQLTLKYNAELSGTWNKKFTTTNYLGGSIQGDWLEGTPFEGTTNGVVLRDIEPEQYAALRALGDFAGICHVRTTDGGNYTANVDVQIGESYNNPGHPETVSLTIKKIDNPRTDGIPLTEWEPGESS